MSDLADIICHLGYKPEDDAWETDGRRTYIHDDCAGLIETRAVADRLRSLDGWRREGLRTFHHESGEVIEIEPGGPDTSGHYLHHIRAAVIA